MATDKPPKLELKLNESARVKLLRDKAYEGESNYGRYFLYAVQVDGADQSFFAPEDIHAQIQAHGLKTGSEFTLKKVAAQNGKKINGQLVFEPINNGEAEPAPKSLNGSDAFKELMRQSIEDAVEISKNMPGIDIQKIGTAIFIARTKSNGFH